MKPNQLGKMLRLWRSLCGLSLRQLAPRIGVSTATLLRLEQGKPCDLPTWMKVQAWLLSESAEEPKP